MTIKYCCDKCGEDLNIEIDFDFNLSSMFSAISDNTVTVLLCKKCKKKFRKWINDTKIKTLC